MNPVKEFLLQSAPLKENPGQVDYLKGMKCTLFAKENEVMTFTDDRCDNDPRPLFADPWEYMNYAKELLLVQYGYTEGECYADAGKMQTIVSALAWRFCASVIGETRPLFVIGLIPNRLVPENAKEIDIFAAMGYVAEPISSAMIRAYQLMHVERMGLAQQKVTMNEVMGNLYGVFKNIRGDVVINN